MVVTIEDFSKKGLDPKKLATALINKKETHSWTFEKFRDFLETPDESIGEKELLEIVKKVIENNRRHARDRDVPEALPGVCAVNLRRLMINPRHVLQPRKEDHNQIAGCPNGYHRQRRNGCICGGKEHRFTKPEAH